MSPEGANGVLHLIAVAVTVAITIAVTVAVAVAVAISVPGASSDVLWTQQLRLCLLIEADRRWQRCLKGTIVPVRERRACRRNVPDGTERFLVSVTLDWRAAPERVEVAVLRRDRRRLSRLPECVFPIAAAHAAVSCLHA